jgi:hypothetical protein
MLKTMRLFAVAGWVTAVVALAVTAQTQTTSVAAERGTRVDGNGYMQVAWGEMSTQRSGR